MYFRVRAKSKSTHHGPLKGIFFLLLSFLLGYCFVLPAQAGAFGQALHKISFLLIGQAAYLIPLFVAWLGIMHLKPSAQIHWRLDTVFAVLAMLSTAAFFSLAGTLFYDINSGGWLGLKLNPFFRRLFGQYLALFITASLSLYLTSLILRISIRKTIIVVWGKLTVDYQEWQKARAELRKMAPPRIKQAGAQAKTEKQGPAAQQQPTIAQKPAEPRILSPMKPAPQNTTAQKPATPVPAKVDAVKKSPDKAGVPAAPAAPPVPYKLPPIEYLAADRGIKQQSNDDHLANAQLLTKILADFNISAKVLEIIPGPVVTRYDIELAPGIKIQAVSALNENLSLAMKSPSVRIVPIPEKSAVGIEVPNTSSTIVGLRGILSSQEFSSSSSLLTLALGRTTDGASYVTDLKPMPHLLIAGATGSGKSVGIHSLILSILYKARPDEVKFMLIDPKRLEMPTYRGLPHLYDPKVPPEKVDIITQPKEAADSLKKLVRVMEQRYEKFAQAAVRNIEGYNDKMAETGGQREFYIVVIIDELADLMLIATRDVEDSIQRLAQMARAVGIHLVLATQRPSVDVITGVIKANFPARIAFQTTSKVDSRVILDTIGAEDLLGRGDMLFFPPGESRPTRLQGAFVSVKEAEQVVNFIRQQNIAPAYENTIIQAVNEEKQKESEGTVQELVQALRLVQERKRVSQDLLKAHFGSSARATNLLSLLETKGFIHKPEGTNRWTIYFDKIEDYIASQPPTDRD